MILTLICYYILGLILSILITDYWNDRVISKFLLTITSGREYDPLMDQIIETVLSKYVCITSVRGEPGILEVVTDNRYRIHFKKIDSIWKFGSVAEIVYLEDLIKPSLTGLYKKNTRPSFYVMMRFYDFLQRYKNL